MLKARIWAKLADLQEIHKERLQVVSELESRLGGLLNPMDRAVARDAPCEREDWSEQFAAGGEDGWLQS